MAKSSAATTPRQQASAPAKHDYAVIMAGGIGSRFWPMSRSSFPKQFHDLLGTGRSLLQSTYDRFAAIVPPQNVYVVTHQQYVAQVREQLPQLAPHQILAEPTGRNTAPCIAYASTRIQALDPQARIVVSPSDHMILNNKAFARDIRTGLQIVGQEPVIVTLGIHPTRPDTGYGYIQYDEDQTVGPQVYRAKTFTEKPTLDVARIFLKSGDFVWNSGIFIFRVDTMLDAIAQFLPDLTEIFEPLRPVAGTAGESTVLAEIYPKCKNISIDFGVMEKARNVYVVRSRFGWSDLGTWASLHKQMRRDSRNNAISGNVLLYEGRGNMVKVAEGKLAVIKGLSNLIVVDLDDVLLICRRSDEQSIREILSDLRNRDDSEQYL